MRVLPLDTALIVMWNIAAKSKWRGDPMAEASVLAAPSAYLADSSRKAIWAAAIGNLLEWYDFGVYAYLASLIATRFFPSSDPTASLLAAFAAYGVGFLARPLGGIVIGRLGDTQGRRGFFGSFQQVSTAGGSLLGSAIAAIMTSSLSSAAMLDWGWRVPFLLGTALLVVGAYLRQNVDETPSYAASREAADDESVVSGLPLGALAFGFTIFWTIAYYTLLAWMPSFTQRLAGLSPSQALWSNTIGLIAMVIAVPIWGALSDRVGRRPLLMASAGSIGLLSFPLFSLMTNGSGLALVLPIQVLFGILLALYSGPGPAAISELFPTHLRSTWMSSGYALAVAIFGGFAPFMATWLIEATGSAVSPTYLYLLPSAVISLLVIWRLKETSGTELV
jgi:MFS transporter, MHS family, proline/betaine transporter